MADRVLADTGALLAALEPRDQYHARARDIAQRHLAGGGRFVCTTLILSELYTLLLARHGPGRAVPAFGAFLQDPAYEHRGVDLELVQRAHGSWLERFDDQSFSLTDAVSFEVMRIERIPVAFAFDHHFVTAGFALLE